MKSQGIYKKFRQSGASFSVKLIVICTAILVTACSDVKFGTKPIVAQSVGVTTPPQTGSSTGVTTPAPTPTPAPAPDPGPSNNAGSCGGRAHTPAFASCGSTSECCWENGDYCASTCTYPNCGNPGDNLAVCRPRQNQDCIFDLNGNPPISPESWPDGFPIRFC